MEEIKELFFDIILSGHILQEDNLIMMLSLLYAKTFNEDYDNVEMNGNTLFVNKCFPFFILAQKEEEIVSIDLFIEEYRRLLLKGEYYEVLNKLKL